MKPAEHEFVRRRSLLLAAQLCFLQSLGLKTRMTVVRQSFDIILNFSNLIVFSSGHVLLFIDDLVVHETVGLITCVVVQDNCHPLVVSVDLRRVLWM